MRIAAAIETLSAYISADIPAFLWGAPGIGKSDIVAQAAEARGLPLIDLRAILLDPVDLRGLPHVIDGRALWARPDFLPDAARDGEAGILFLDELNVAPASTQAACYQLILNRKIGEYRLPPGWRIVAAGNRQTDRAAAQRMPSALANRLAHIDVDSTVDDWAAWANKAGIDPFVIGFLRFRPNLLHSMGEGDLRAFPTPRSWSQVSKVMSAPDALRFGLVSGLVGEGAAAEFIAYLKIAGKLPPIRTILDDPENAPLVSASADPGLLYALSAALARASTPQNFANVLRYMERGGAPEFAVMLVSDACKRNAALAETKAFVEFVTNNQGVSF